MNKLLKISFLFFVIGCSSTNYLNELSYIYPSTDFHKAILKKKQNIDKNYTLTDDNGENLSEEELYLREKYSIILGISPNEIKNYKLYSFIDLWLDTPYKEKSFQPKVSVDCPYFIQALYSEVYNTTFAKTPDGIFRSKVLQLFTGRTFLKEGDILFFRYDKFQPISDVGLYLGNNRIVACSQEKLSIFDLNNPYFQLRYVCAGRLKK